MKTLYKKLKDSIAATLVLTLFGVLTFNCGSDDGIGLNVNYSGTSNFNFTGDTTLTFLGKANEIRIFDNTNTNREILPVTFTNDDDLDLTITLQGDPNIEAGTYTYATGSGNVSTFILLSGEIYDTKSGTVTITKLNKQEIRGTVDVVLRAFLSSADDIFLEGTFDLMAE